MVNLCKINVVTSALELPILRRIPWKFPALNYAYTNPFLSENILGNDITIHMSKVIHFILINKNDIPTRTMEYSPGMTLPYHSRNGQILNISLLPLEWRTGPFFLMHKLSQTEAEATALVTANIFLDTRYKEVFLYEPEFTQVVDICKFA